MTHSLAAEAKRLHERYIIEFVERLALCPWAKEARERGQVRHHVCLDETPDTTSLQTSCHDWRDDKDAVVAFILLPLYRGTREAFSDFVDLLRQTDLASEFAMAPFFPRHPDDEVSLVEFLRQSPDPTVQLVRHGALAEVRGADRPKYADIFEVDVGALHERCSRKEVYESVFNKNRDKVAQNGRAALRAVLDSIRADRERAYAGLLPSLR